MNSDHELFSLRPATAYYELPTFSQRGKRNYAAPNPPFGAYIKYCLMAYNGDEISISIADAKDKVIRKHSGPMTPGFHRFMWDLKPELEDEGGGFFGHNPSSSNRAITP